MEVRIIAIRKDNGNHYNPYEAVSHYKWINETNLQSNIATRQELVSWIEQGNKCYVRSKEGKVYCFVNVSSSGTKFLQTQSDDKSSNNLLNLPEC